MDLQMNQFVVDTQSEASLEAALDAMILAVDDPDSVKEVAKYGFFSFEFGTKKDGEFELLEAPNWDHVKDPENWMEVYVSDEAAFFEAVVQFPSLVPKVKEYLENIFAYNRQNQFHALYTSDEVTAGTYALVPLIATDKTNIELYARNMKTQDMNHEVNEYPICAWIFLTYGWCDETLALLAARSTTCVGQSGTDQFDAALERMGLEAALGDPELASSLQEAFIQEIEQGEDVWGMCGEWMSWLDGDVYPNTAEVFKNVRERFERAEMAMEALVEAVEAGDLGGIREHAPIAGAKINEPAINVGENSDATVLDYAICEGNYKMAELLLELGADMHAAEDYGSAFTSIPERAFPDAEMIERIQFLLDRGANINSVDGDWYSILGAAALAGRAEICRYLLDKGADIHQDADGTPIDMAYTKRRNYDADRMATCNLLLERGANPNSGDCMNVAAELGLLDHMRLLLDHGVDINHVSRRGKTPAQIALAKRNMTTLRFLADHGAELDADAQAILELDSSADRQTLARQMLGNDSLVQREAALVALLETTADAAAKLECWRAKRCLLDMNSFSLPLMQQVVGAARSRAWMEIEQEIVPWLGVAPDNAGPVLLEVAQAYAAADSALFEPAVALLADRNWSLAKEHYAEICERRPSADKLFFRDEVVCCELQQRRVALKPHIGESALLDDSHEAIARLADELYPILAEALPEAAEKVRREHAGLYVNIDPEFSDDEFVFLRRASAYMPAVTTGPNRQHSVSCARAIDRQLFSQLPWLSEMKSLDDSSSQFFGLLLAEALQGVFARLAELESFTDVERKDKILFVLEHADMKIICKIG